MRSWTEEQLKLAVSTSSNYCESMRKIGLRPVGGNYKSVKGHIIRLQLDVSHFTKESMLAPLAAYSRGVRIPDDVLFRRDNPMPSNGRLRRRVIQLGFMLYVCKKCGNVGSHMGEKLVLHLDHENGDHADCRKENLRWLCPNCHSQTPTYARSIRDHGREMVCSFCTGTFRGRRKESDKNHYCSRSCAARGSSLIQDRKTIADRDEMFLLYERGKNFSEIARIMGVSNSLVGRVIRKRERALNKGFEPSPSTEPTKI